MLEPIRFTEAGLRILDQTRLPAEVVYLDLTRVEEVFEAIQTLRVRGAPAIGIAAAYGLCLSEVGEKACGAAEFAQQVEGARRRLAESRPTAVNLFWALDRMKRRLDAEMRSLTHPSALREALIAEARAIHAEDRENNRRMGEYGAALIPDGARILTHCNAGALATGGFGTALGVIRAAVAQGKRVEVFADETRPLLQGARLTTHELMADGIPVTLIADNMAASLMHAGRIDLAIVGADRVTAHGDVCNKIGTYGVAALCRFHGLPFYAAVPVSTIDLSLAHGGEIPIEQRGADELRRIGGVWTAPPEVPVYNPAFDVTPHELVTAIITENGVAHAPYKPSLSALVAAGRVGGRSSSIAATRAR